MNSLATTLRNLPVKGRIDRMTLQCALNAFGLPGEDCQDPAGNHSCHRNRKGKSHALIRSNPRLVLNEWELRDLFGRARKHWLEGCKAIQTQFTEHHEAAARWNALWQRVKYLFQKRGVEV